MNNKGFALQDLLFFISFFLIILVVCVIVIDSNISKFNDVTEEPKNVSEINEAKKEEKVEVEENKKLTDYDILLEKMVNTAKIYVTTNYTGKTDQIIIKTSKLVTDEYMDELIDPKDKENKCIGYIIYDGESSYTPYLRCDDNYKSENYNETFE